ncbi:MAG: PRC-barrel domain-containing protein [Planctomycetes bacterium]|nr:PRC-barrel domain-containing protein [Planctomycetota bacterium]
MSATTPTHVLIHLSHSGLHLPDPQHDLRGYQVVDATGAAVGIVEDLVVDEGDLTVRCLDVVSNGFLGFARDHLLIPIQAMVAVGPGIVRIDRLPRSATNAGAADARLAVPSLWEPVYGSCDRAPIWHDGAPSTPPPYT